MSAPLASLQRPSWTDRSPCQRHTETQRALSLINKVLQSHSESAQHHPVCPPPPALALFHKGKPNYSHSDVTRLTHIHHYTNQWETILALEKQWFIGNSPENMHEGPRLGVSSVFFLSVVNEAWWQFSVGILPSSGSIYKCWMFILITDV